MSGEKDKAQIERDTEARIVAWLRDHPFDCQRDPFCAACALENAAQAIESGEHRDGRMTHEG